MSERTKKKKQKQGKRKGLSRLPHLPSLPVCCLPPSLSSTDDKRGLSVAQSTKQQKQGLKGDMTWTWSVHSPSAPYTRLRFDGFVKNLIGLRLRRHRSLVFILLPRCCTKEWAKIFIRKNAKVKVKGRESGIPFPGVIARDKQATLWNRKQSSNKARSIIGGDGVSHMNTSNAVGCGCRTVH